MGGQRGRLIPPNERQQAIGLIEEACASGARKHKACEILEITLRTLERWQKSENLIDQRTMITRTPSHALNDEERQCIIDLSNSLEFCNLPPTQIVPKLADEGIYYASESSFYRILREHKLLQHRSSSRPNKHKKPKEFIATAPNQLWSWDITYLMSLVSGIYFYLYLFIDIFSRKIIGWAIHENELADHASNLVQQIYLDEGVREGEVVLHSDNGGPMKGATMLMTLKKLGISTSFSRPSVSDDNPYSESLFKTMKYRFDYPSKPFKDIEAAVNWVEKFVRWYNYEHCHSAIKFVTPQQRHTLVDKAILAYRDSVYQAAKLKTPSRWSGKTRDWSYISAVKLNPGKSKYSEIVVCS